MRASRLLSILLLLQARGRMNAVQLAEELEVSVRTIYRDVESLGEAGIPIYADRGPTGGYQLIGGYRTRLTGLSGDEAESLFLAGLPAAAAELGLGETLASAQLKFLAALPPDIRASAARVRERFHLDAPAWFHAADEAPHLAEVAGAVWRQSLLRVRYLRAGSAGERVRLLAPLGVVLKSGVWYLVAQAYESPPAGAEDAATPAAEAREEPARDIRVYRVSRILDLATLDERFERPADFDLADFWRAWSQGFEDRLYRGEAIVRLSPRAMGLRAFYFGPLAARAVEASAGPPNADGWMQATLPIESIQYAAADLLRLGMDIEVLSPPELRERMAEISSALAARYRVDAHSAACDAGAGERANGEEREQRRDGEVVGQ